MVRLDCGQREYRIWFEKKLWDTRSIGAWSSYSGIHAITAEEIVLADGEVDVPPGVRPTGRYSLKLHRKTLELVEVESDLGEGMIAPSVPVAFDCTVTEKIDA